MAQAQKFRPPAAKSKQTQKTPTKNATPAKVAVRNTSSDQQEKSQQASVIGFDQTTSTRAMHRLVGDILGSLFYVRSIIPDDNFVDTFKVVPQRARPNGSMTAAQHLPIKRFRNHYSSEASDVIGWLDFGILGALDKKYLKSLIVVVYLEEETRSKAIEAYTFNFTYGDDLTVAQQMDLLNVGGSSSQSQASEGSQTRNMRDAFDTSTRRIMREVWRHAGLMTDLPHQVTFDFKIFFTDDTPEDYQPVAFQNDESEIFLASHASDEAPMTYDSEATASTGFHNMTCHIASIAHCLANKGEMEIDPTANENEVREAKTRLNREHQRAVEEDEDTRNVLWPLEQTIYGKSSSTLVDSSQIESATVEPTKQGGFSYPVGQMLPDGTIKAIPKGQQRWYDSPDEVNIGRARSGPLQQRRSFREALINKPGLEAWNMPTQNATQNQAQNQSQTLFRDESMQVETASTMMAFANHDSQIPTQAPQIPEIVLQTEMEDEEEVPPLIKGKATAPAEDEEPPSSQSTQSSGTGPQTPEDEEFDLSAVPKVTRPKSPIRRRRSASVKSTSKAKPKAKAKVPPTAFQISATLAQKPKPKAKKRAQNVDGTTSKPSHKKKSTSNQTTSDATITKAAKASKAVTTAPKGATIVNRVAPRTFAALDSQTSTIENPDEMQVDQFPLSQDTTPSQVPPQIQSQLRSQGASSQSRFHPYANRQASPGPSTRPGSSQGSQRVLPVPKTHMKRVKSSRGVRGLDFRSRSMESKRPLPVVAEQP